MLILLPPSETKRHGGTGAPLDLDLLGFPALTPTRRRLIGHLLATCADGPAARIALKLSSGQSAEIALNTRLWQGATLPALDRYTGVLFDHLNAGSMSAVQRARADRRVVIASALFGAARATDPIPAYRFSAGSRLPGSPLGASWRSVLPGVLTDARSGPSEPVIDLRSTAYAALGPVPGALRVTVVSADSMGEEKTVSHFSKAAKGALARALSSSRAELDTLSSILQVCRRAGLRIEHRRQDELTMVT